MIFFLRNILRETIYGNGLTAFLRIAVGMVFVWSGGIKLIDPAGFGKIVGMYGILPEPLAPYAAVTIPAIELVAGALLAAGYRIKPAALIAASLLLVFIAVTAYSFARGERFDCGCFGLARFGIDETIGLPLIARNIALFAVTIVLFRARRHVVSIEAIAERTRLREL
ncbi:MAG TPA: MauE/DoxX family redox-associated membrane protein [Spirochaetota bacterium]|nr:MauE/DoxX family redox-associated membrane protein [Spirochaetota bacterium]